MTDTDTPDPDPISLDELARAFAQVMGAPPGRAAETPRPPAAEAATGTGELRAEPPHEPALTVDESPGDDSGPVTPLGILEAMLFVGDRDNRPLTAARAAELMRGVEPGEIDGLIADLNRRYRQSGCPYFVAEDSDGYRITLRKPFYPLREQFYGRIRQARLSQAAIDVLAIVAYQQPLTAEQVGAVRGKPSGAVLSQLVHRCLLRIERLPGKRRTVQYFTTDRFLQLFGLQTLADLPQSEELDRQ
jgi:segregation and condensation protein B